MEYMQLMKHLIPIVEKDDEKSDKDNSLVEKRNLYEDNLPRKLINLSIPVKAEIIEPKIREYVPRTPTSHRLVNSKDNAECVDILEVSKHVLIKLPILFAIRHVPFNLNFWCHCEDKTNS